MKINSMKWVAVAAVSGALAFVGCQKKDQAPTSPEPVAKTDQPQTGNDTTQPESGTMGGSLNTPATPELAHPGAQGEAVAPQPIATAPSTALGTAGTETATGLGMARNDDVKPGDTSDLEAAREAAATAAAERLGKLDARMIDVRARIDLLSSPAAFNDTLTDLKQLHLTAQGSINSIRDPMVKLDEARDFADRRMTQFEAAINSLQQRVERAAAASGA